MGTGKLNVRLIAILAALTLITFSVWHTLPEKKASKAADVPKAAVKKGNIPDLQPTDHIRGNPDAPIMIVVYSDFGCPYCKDFHQTMQQIMKLYGRDGNVSWVYRHMPLTKLHPEAATYALASECVSQQGGNAAFWDYADKLYATVSPEYSASSEELTRFAEEIGIPRGDFISCMQSNGLMDRIEASFEEALASGATETPYIVIVTPYEQLVQSGAQDFAVFGGIIKTMLRVLGAQSTLKSDEAMPNFFEEMSGGTTTTSTTTLVATTTSSTTVIE